MRQTESPHPRVIVGGIETISCTRAEMATLLLHDCLEARQNSDLWLPKLVFSSNGQGIALAGKSPTFMRIMSDADVVHADGMHVVFSSKMTNAPLPERIPTTDFFHDAARIAEPHGLRFFMLGATEKQNAAAVEAIKVRYPRLNIVGRHHGYFTENEDAVVCKKIRESKADVVWVALGKPRQEEWCYRNRKHLRGVGWLKTCGGLFAFLAHDVPRAPNWMQKSGLEWLYRLLNDPKRLTWRYLTTNPYAFYRLVRFTKRKSIDDGRLNTHSQGQLTRAEKFRTARTKLWRAFRLNFLLQFVSDERYLKLLFWSRFGERLDLANPRSFSQKIQWLKLNDRQDLYTKLVDKYDVKAWVAEKVGASFVLPTLGVWDTFEQINFDALPEQFVLKCTHDSGGLAICKNKSTFDFRAARKKINRSLSRNFYRSGREWPYLNVKPRVLAEVYFPTWVSKEAQANGLVPDPTGPTEHDRSVLRNGVFDYKFYCFHGDPKFLYVSQGLHNHSTAEMIFLTLDWAPTGFVRPDYGQFQEIPAKPSQFNQMVQLAKELSAGIPFVRVDLFEHHGAVYFSEMTFHPVSGMMPIKPETADLEIGQLLDLSEVEVAK